MRKDKLSPQLGVSKRSDWHGHEDELDRHRYSTTNINLLVYTQKFITELC